LISVIIVDINVQTFALALLIIVCGKSL